MSKHLHFLWKYSVDADSWSDLGKTAECTGKHLPEMHKTIRVNGRDFAEKEEFFKGWKVKGWMSSKSWRFW